MKYPHPRTQSSNLQSSDFHPSNLLPSLILILFCLSISAFGQSTIAGRVLAQEQYLSYATVRLINQDSAVVNGTVSDDLGQFIFHNLSPGRYRIGVSMIGYVSTISEWILLGDNHFIHHDMLMEEASFELGEVIVKSEKEQFDQETDRLVLNLQNSIVASGNSVLEVLQRSPGVVVNRQENNITMNGKSGVRIMINDKIVYAPLEVVVQMLDGMAASNVEKIEFITSPPAKYDAEGNAGVIHIVTKTSEVVGTNGRLGITVGARHGPAVGGNFNLNHRSRNFAGFFDYSITRNENLHRLKISRRLPDEPIIQDNVRSRRENVTIQQNLSGGLEWKLRNSSTFNLGFSGYSRNWSMASVVHDQSRVSLDSILITDMRVNQKNIWQSATGTVGFQTKINSTSELGFSLDYLYYDNDNPSRYDNRHSDEQQNTIEISRVDLQKHTPISFVVAKADYKYSSTEAFTLEAGIKTVTSALTNKVFVQRLIDQIWTTDPSFSSYSILNERIAAVYVSTKWLLPSNWQINGGLRYEYTHSTISEADREKSVERNYGYIFPNFSVTKKVAHEQDIQFSYGRRITRPTYNDIASFAAFWSPNTFTAGNTSLWPAVSDAVRVGYHLKQWNISMEWSNVKNEIVSLQPEVERNSNTLIYKSQNLSFSKLLSLTNFWSCNINPWWEFQNSVTAQYQTVQTSHLLPEVTLEKYGLNINLMNVWKLPEDFAIELSGYFQSSQLSGISEYLAVGSLNIGIQKKLGANGILKLSIDDLLYTNNWRIRTDLPANDLDLNFNYDWHNRFIRLTYTCNIGNNTLKSLRIKSGSEEERKRVSN